MTTLDLIAPAGALTDLIARRLCTEYLTTLVELANEVTTWSTSWTELLRCAVDITNTDELIVCGCCNRPIVLTVTDDEDPERPGTATADIIRVLNHQDRILTEHRYHRPPPEPPRGPTLDLPAHALYALRTVLDDLSTSGTLSTCRAAAEAHTCEGDT